MNFIRNRNFRAGPQTSLEGFICPQNSDKQQKIKVFGRSEVGGSKAAGPAKCGAQSSKNKKAAPVCVFENPEFGMVRMATDEKGEPWFCAKDLCDALGYKRADLAVKQHVNPHDAAKRCVWVEVGKKLSLIHI